MLLRTGLRRRALVGRGGASVLFGGAGLILLGPLGLGLGPLGLGLGLLGPLGFTLRVLRLHLPVMRLARPGLFGLATSVVLGAGLHLAVMRRLGLSLLRLMLFPLARVGLLLPRAGVAG